MRGFGNRNIYPGLGAGLPESFQWQDVARIAACGGNTLRVGHQAPYLDAFRACDEYGVLLIVNSGDNEWALKDEPALTYKREYDRDLIIAYRNHPCVAVWESNNGLPWDGERYWPAYTKQEVDKWDFIAPRLVSNRDGFPEHWDKSDPIVISYTNRYEKHPDYPSLNAEVYGTNWSGNPSLVHRTLRLRQRETVLAILRAELSRRYQQPRLRMDRLDARRDLRRGLHHLPQRHARPEEPRLVRHGCQPFPQAEIPHISERAVGAFRGATGRGAAEPLEL